jgi:hypothetical protein
MRGITEMFGDATYTITNDADFQICADAVALVGNHSGDDQLAAWKASKAKMSAVSSYLYLNRHEKTA